MHCYARRFCLALAHRYDDQMRLLLLVVVVVMMIMMITMIMVMIHGDVDDVDDDDDDDDGFRVTRGYVLKLQASTCRTYKRDIALCARHQCTSQNRILDPFS